MELTTSFETIEEQLNQEPLLYFKGYKHDPLLSVDNFVTLLITDLFVNRNTSEKKRATIQCEKGKNRSFGNVYRLVKFYYPDISVKELYRILVDGTFRDDYRTLYCADVNKRIFYVDKNYQHNWIYHHDEYRNVNIHEIFGYTQCTSQIYSYSWVLKGQKKQEIIKT